MKISAQHVAQLHAQLDMAGHIREHVSKRVRWDAMWMLPRAFRQGWFDEVYQYAHDEHVDTALRAYFKD